MIRTIMSDAMLTR